MSHVPAEQRVRERVVQAGHGEPVAMARTLLGARAGQGGRERLQAAALIAPAQRPGGRGAAGGGKGRCRVGREVAHPGPSPDPDEEISTIRLFR